ncbi:MAG: potassium transporter KtrB [Clostridia bacterium]|nr:potassium transporter KtrB [Clostridia bacterium]
MSLQKSLGKHRIRNFTPIILLSFLVAVFAGSGLLALPVSSAEGVPHSYLDALFTATTSVCVTGLVTVPTVSAWSGFGQAVILVLIQIGGLGIITCMTAFLLFFHQKAGLGQRLLIQEALNLNSLSGILGFLKRILLGTFAVEGICALLYMIVFVPEYGYRGVWISVFHSVSAFCNAGLDLISENSLCPYSQNSLLLSVTSAEIILGGIGFVVWWDVIRVLRERKQKRGRCLSRLTLHSKIALSMTFILLIGGTAAFLILEYRNPETLGPLSFLEKIQVAAFQSVTTRTAGFATVPQESLTAGSWLLTLILMCIGGSPVGTAGGIKTVTIAVLLASARAAIQNKEETTCFERSISKEATRKALGVVCSFLIIVLLSALLLAAATGADAEDVLFESVSAAGTVGLTRGLTGTLNDIGKLIVSATMFLGRVGPISLAIVFLKQKNKGDGVRCPTEEVQIG